MQPIPILVPLLNANEPEARLVEVHVQDRQPVQKGDLLFTIETTKAASDVESLETGYLRLVAKVGDTLEVGDILAFITDTADEVLNIPANASSSPTSSSDLSSLQSGSTLTNLRITRPARILAESLGIDFAALPMDRLLTESMIRELAGKSGKVVKNSSALIIYGAGGHAKTVMEMAQTVGSFRIAGIIDDNPALTGTTVLGLPVLGTRELLPQLFEQGIHLAANGVGGIININIRIKLFDLLAGYGFSFPALRHPRAIVEPSAQIYDGVQVFANAYVGSSAVLHKKCMINTSAIVSHDCEIGSFSHIAPGAMLAGHVSVGEGALVGMGVTTTIGLKIGSGARIGNGAVLLADVPDRAIIPAGKVWSA